MALRIGFLTFGLIMGCRVYFLHIRFFFIWGYTLGWHPIDKCGGTNLNYIPFPPCQSGWP